jgi:four helix bundle protein
MPLQSYRELRVWQRGMDLVVEVYKLAKLFPKEEQFGITSQLKRASVSIVLNVAEGYGRQHRGDYLRFLSIARGSCCETETILILVGRLGLATKEQLNPAWAMTQEVGKMLRSLQAKLNTDGQKTDS